jgi:hypothetical protein
MLYRGGVIVKTRYMVNSQAFGIWWGDVCQIHQMGGRQSPRDMHEQPVTIGVVVTALLQRQNLLRDIGDARAVERVPCICRTTAAWRGPRRHNEGSGETIVDDVRAATCAIKRA